MSRARRSNLTLVTTFILALGAGLVVGMAAARRGAAAHTTPAAQQQYGHSRTAAELNLTPQQEEQVRGIWSGVSQGPLKTINESRKAFQKERDDSVSRLFTSEQKAEYDRIQAEYAAKTSNLSKERQQLVDGAVEQVKRVLNDTQRQKYEQMLKDRGGHGRRVLGGPGRESRNSPTTHPAAGGGAGTSTDGQNAGRSAASPNSNK